MRLNKNNTAIAHENQKMNIKIDYETLPKNSQLC